MIKRIFYIFSFLFSFSQIQAQAPMYDECSTAIQLGIAPNGTCTTTEYTNVDATLSSGLFSTPSDNIPTCWGSVDHDVWFEFQTPMDGSFVDFEVTVTSTGSNPIGQFKAALYRGECIIDELAELDCQVAAAGDTEIKFDAAGLTPGISYFIRVDDQSSTASPVWGTFNVCVDSLPDINLMCLNTDSDANSGILYDSGGPDNNYSNNENCTFTICPASNPGCIALTVNTHDTEPGFDELEFFDGNTTNATELGEDVSAGGSCYTVYASSGCITVEWNADFIINDAGFEITWESSANPCPTYVGANATTSPSEALIIEKLGSLPSSVSNVTVNCDGDAHAAFDGGDNTGLFMPNGVVLTTGSVDYAFMPNDSDGDPNLDLNSNSDADLATLAATFSNNQTPLTDACILEMDVLAAGSELSLEYIFGSDDYVGNIGSNAGRDVMGIWISGPGIVGSPDYNGQELISVLPGTNTPVHYVNVNPQVNFEYYRKNEETILGPHYDGVNY